MRILPILTIVSIFLLSSCATTDVVDPSTVVPTMSAINIIDLDLAQSSSSAMIVDNTPYRTDGTRPAFLSMARRWKTDWSINNIDYDDILSGGPPRDGIPSIDNPSFESYESANEWLANREPIISLVINGDARAYPLGILTRHEIVNDTVGSIPIIVTYCPLCNSAIVFDRRVGNDIFEFGVSGLLRHSDMIMYDRTTESLWQQFTGDGIVGELTGTQLTFLPSQIISYADFKTNYPHGQVLSPVNGTGVNPYIGYDTTGTRPFLFRDTIDPRLDGVARVVTLSFDDGIDIAYPVDLLREVHVINDQQNDHDLAIFWTPDTATALGASRIAEAADVGATGVFDPNIGGQKLTFAIDDEQHIVDEQTGSTWSITGRSVDGQLAGEQLTPIIHADHFWFAWAVFRPNTLIYAP